MIDKLLSGSVKSPNSNQSLQNSAGFNAGSIKPSSTLTSANTLQSSNVISIASFTSNTSSFNVTANKFAPAAGSSGTVYVTSNPVASNSALSK